MQNLHLVVGDDEFLISRATRAITYKACANDPDCEVAVRAAADLTVGEVPELLSPSLFAAARVVVLNAAHDAGKPVATAILAHAEQLPVEIVLVVSHAGGAKGRALAEGLRAIGALEQRCAKITKPRERLAFVRDEIVRAQGRALPGAAELIVEAVGADLRELATVCAQLVADTGGTVDTEAVHRYHRGRADASGFAVADAVMAGDEAGALEALRWAITAGVDPVPVSDALADGVRTVARVAAGGGANAYQLAGELGLPPWKVEKAQRVARRWSTAALSEAMRIAADANAAVKGTASDRVYALERAVTAMVASQGRRGVVMEGQAHG